MLKPSYIKEAREKKGLTIYDVASRLRLNPSIIKNIEEGVDLTGVYASYEISYKKSIYKLLGIKIHKSKKKIYYMDNGLQILMILYFIIFFSFSIMTITYYLISNFSNNQTSKLFINNYREDDLMILFRSITKKSELDIIDSRKFLEILYYDQKKYTNTYFYIQLKPNTQSYYKIYFMRDGTEKFGQLNYRNSLLVDKKKEFLIDISDTSSIDFLIFNNAKYKLRDDFRYYLKNFDIKSLYNLK
ncbi:MAG: helix-turn-helix domain-containing protein [Alphaproteobacteria bacterium]|nr:helix-turn-helix domain-containing protein [Alphaproteobacteria bacterium]